MKVLLKVLRTIQTQIWWTVTAVVMVMMVVEVTGLSGPNVCMVKQKYNITKRVKYRAPMSVRTYEWCFAMPPRCSRWNTEMRDVTRLETEERTAEMAACCPGYKLKGISCVPICPNGKTGQGCTEDCPQNKWGPNCAHECKPCEHGSCDPGTGECRCQDGWQGESCESSMATTAAVAMMEQLLTTAKSTTSTKLSTHTLPTITTRSTTIATTTSTVPPPVTSMTPIITEKITTTPATTTKKEIITSAPYTPTQRINVIFNNATSSTFPSAIETYKLIPEITTKRINLNNEKYNRTELPIETTKPVPTTRSYLVTDPPTVVQTTEVTTISTTTKPTRTSTLATSTKENIRTTIKLETTRHSETTLKQHSTTKFKPKEIWIKPAQKGESQLVESKVKLVQELPQVKAKVNEVTSPKTIIVSIIPTSVSYITFKKIALTTALSKPQKNNSTTSSHNKSTDKEYTKPMSVHTTAAPVTVKILQKTPTTINPLIFQNVSKTKTYTSYTKGTLGTTLPTNQSTNSMTSTLNAANKILNSSLLTTVSSFSTNASRTTRSQLLSEPSINKHNLNAPTKNQTTSKTGQITERPDTKQFVTAQNNGTNPVKRVTESSNVTTSSVAQVNANSKGMLTKSNTNTVTDDPSKDEETFHILTEPEHITAVMGDKGTDRSTIDLISVISIAGGVMMAVITVAVFIVMLERCKRPRYEDVRKYNDIRMQVMMDNNDIPPPYVRSIFHTPLPEPPTTDKCHYQPISTLDRNLKQFMRPVVVQTISPLMLENFRGILECHYDHLPRRSQDMGSMPTHYSVAPSIEEHAELLPPRGYSLTESDIEAMKCEAKLDVIDNTTSEPLYAEIPCWRPPSARATEVINHNSEAVTEL